MAAVSSWQATHHQQNTSLSILSSAFANDRAPTQVKTCPACDSLPAANHAPSGQRCTHTRTLCVQALRGSSSRGGGAAARPGYCMHPSKAKTSE